MISADTIEYVTAEGKNDQFLALVYPGKRCVDGGFVVILCDSTGALKQPDNICLAAATAVRTHCLKMSDTVMVYRKFGASAYELVTFTLVHGEITFLTNPRWFSIDADHLASIVDGVL